VTDNPNIIFFKFHHLFKAELNLLRLLHVLLELAVLPIPLQARLAAADPITYKKLSPLN